MITQSFAEIYTQVQNFIQDTTSGTLTIIKDEINKEYERLAASYLWPELNGFLNESVTWTADQAYLALPADAAELLTAHDKTNDYTLINRSLGRLIEENVSTFDNATSVLYYAELGVKAIKRPLSVADKIQVLSETAGDTQTIRVVGLRDSPEVRQAESIVLNGTTAVDSAVTYREGWSIDSLSTNGSPAGVITIREKTTPGNVLAHLPIGEKYTAYYVIQLENPPSTADTLTITYKKRVFRMSNDNDAPIIPVSQVLVENVKGLMRQYDKKYVQGDVHLREGQRVLSAILSERKLQSDKKFQFRPEKRFKLWRAY